MKSFLGVLFLIAALIAVPVPSASAATCDDYSNQKEAQQNADTRDADGDGIYCESLPCPCQKPGDNGGGGGGDDKPSKPKKKKKKKKKPTSVYRGYIVDVVDGDTIKVDLNNGKTKTVRLIGIDTPETKKPNTPVECGGLQATSTAFQWAFPDAADTNGDGLFDSGNDGRWVKLVLDRSKSITDRYGRLLAYVYGSDGSSLARTLPKAGWADTYYYRGGDFKKSFLFESDREAAMIADLGVFGACGGNFHLAQ